MMSNILYKLYNIIVQNPPDYCCTSLLHSWCFACAFNIMCHDLTSSNIIKHHQTPSNTVTHHQTPSNTIYLSELLYIYIYIHGMFPLNDIDMIDILWPWRPRSHPGDCLAAADTFREFVVYDADQIYPATWDEECVCVRACGKIHDTHV